MKNSFFADGFATRPLRTSLLILFMMFTAYAFAGCELTKNTLDSQDRSTNSSRQDYRDGLAPREADLDSFASDNADIPPLESYVADSYDSLRPMPLVSVSVNQTIPLRDVLFELADQAGYDLELDPRISGSIIFTARNRPLDTVIERISQIAGLRYTFENDILRVELDTPYTKNYKIDYLTIVRNSSSSISNSASVVSGGGAEAGSSFTISSESESDFWAELEANLEQILTSNAGQNVLRTSVTPDVTVASANPEAPVVPVAPIDEAAVTGDGSPTPTPGQDASQPPVVNNTVLQVSALPEDNLTGAGAEDDPNAVSFTPAFSVNRQAGIISVYANERIHKQVSEYLDELRKQATSQVLIEAKVLEVGLTDEYAAGINWGTVDGLLGGELAFGFGGTPVNPGLTPTSANSFTIAYSGNDIGAIVDAISRFGSVHALASPRLTVLNNQAAVLNVAENIVYFTLDIEDVEGTDNNAPRQTIESEVNSVPEGVLINVLPVVNADTQSITLQVRPTVTRVVDNIPDPAAAALGVTSTIPQLNVQEIDSVLNMRSGQVAILGGLLQDVATSSTDAVPVLGEVPVVGSLFRKQNDSIQKSELVIFLKATIVDAPGSIHNTDKELYRQFAQDRRPLKF